MEINEIEDRYKLLVKAIDKKKTEATKIMTDLEALCREALSLQKKLEENGRQDKDQ